LAGLALGLLSLLFAGSADAETRTWDGGCGAETAWSCAANWSENIVPEATDTAVFGSASVTNSTVDEEFAGSVASIRINGGYTGTITLARSLVVSTSFSQTGGTFIAGGEALTLKAVALTGGSFTASSGTTSIGGSLKISAGAVFNANGGTVTFDGASGALSCAENTFNLVTFANTKGTKTVGAGCLFPLGANPKADKGGSIALNGELSGSGTLTTAGTLTLGTTGELSGFSGLETGNLTVKGSYNFGTYEPFTVGGAFSLTAGGSFTAPGPGATASFGKNFTLSPEATFDANEGTVNFDGASGFKLACGGKTFELVTFESSGSKTIGSDCTLPLGTNPDLGTGKTLLKGTLSGAGDLTQTGAFEIESTSPGLDSFTNVTDAGAFVLRSGSGFTAPSGVLTVNGNFLIKAGATFDANEGTVNFQALPTAQKIISCSEATFSLVTFTNVAREVVRSDCTLPLGSSPTIGGGGAIVLNGALTGSETLTVNSSSPLLLGTGSLVGFSGLSAGDLSIFGAYNFGSYESFAVSGDFAIALGAEFTAPEGIASFAGDFVDGGTFKANEGTVELTGSGQTLSGSTTFDDLTKVVEASDTLTFAASATQTINGALILEGASSEALLNLVSSKPGTHWLIASGGSRAVKWVSVADSTNTSTTISAVESKDKGGNTGWSF
jgi:hypothetical protein